MAKKIPLRQCVGCRVMKPKTELVRVVKNQSGEVELDMKGKMPGRGAYLCGEAACLKKTQKSKALERGLSTKIEDAIYKELEQALEEKSKEVSL